LFLDLFALAAVSLALGQLAHILELFALQVPSEGWSSDQALDDCIFVASVADVVETCQLIDVVLPVELTRVEFS